MYMRVEREKCSSRIRDWMTLIETTCRKWGPKETGGSWRLWEGGRYRVEFIWCELARLLIEHRWLAGCLAGRMSGVLTDRVSAEQGGNYFLLRPGTSQSQRSNHVLALCIPHFPSPKQIVCLRGSGAPNLAGPVSKAEFVPRPERTGSGRGNWVWMTDKSTREDS